MDTRNRTLKRAFAITAVMAAFALAFALEAAWDASGPAVAVVGQPPADLDGMPVDIPNGAKQVSGWYFPGKPGRGSVVLLHGIRANRISQVDKIRLMRPHGFAILAIDQQAHGESAGDAITFGARESESADAAIVWLRAKVPGERLAVVGMSMGAAAAVLASTRVPVDALVIEAPYADLPTALGNRLALRIAEPARALAGLPIWLGERVLGFDSRDLDLVQRIRDVRAPLLVVAGAKDELATVDEARQIFDAANGPKDIWIVNNAGHVDFARRAPEPYAARVIGFLSEHLSLPTTADTAH